MTLDWLYVLRVLEAAHERRRCRDRETNEVITEVALDDLWVNHGSFAGEINNAPRHPWMKLDCIWKTADLDVARMTLGGRRRPPPRRRREGQGGTSTGCRRAPLGPRSRSVLASPAPAKNTTEERKKDATDAQDVGGPATRHVRRAQVGAAPPHHPPLACLPPRHSRPSASFNPVRTARGKGLDPTTWRLPIGEGEASTLDGRRAT